MPPPTPPLDQLAVFEAAARHESFARAAAELGVTQSAVSQRVRLLEQRLGRALFRRLPRALALTPDGRALQGVVGDALRRLREGTGALFPPPGRARVAVKATLGYAQLVLLPALPALLAEAPDLELTLSTAIWAGPGLEPGLDLEVRAGEGPWPGLLAERLTAEQVFPVAAPALARRLGEPAALARQRLLAVPGFREAWPAWFAAAGQPWPDPPPRLLSFDTAAMSLAAAEAGLGIALARSALAAGALKAGRLRRLFQTALPAAESFWLLRPADRPPSPAAERVRAWLLRG
jgi:LysR family glycine cleavage system transcriptional activator